MSFNKYLRILTEHLLSLVSFLIYSGFRSSRLQMFFKIVTLKNFVIFIGKQRLFIKRQTSGTTSDNEWKRVVQRVWQRMTTSDNEWYNEWYKEWYNECYKEWQRMITSGTTSDSEWYKEWQRVVQQVATSDNEWQQMVQRVTTSDNRWHRMTRSDNKWQFWPNFLFSNNMVLVWAALHFITPEVTADNSNRCIQNLCKLIKEYYCGIS